MSRISLGCLLLSGAVGTDRAVTWAETVPAGAFAIDSPDALRDYAAKASVNGIISQ